MSSSVKRTSSPSRWLYGTNFENIKNIIAQGLITGPDGFTKYYIDVLEMFPGWIPLFNRNVPINILEKSTSEATDLKVCVVEFSLEGLSGLVKALGKISTQELLAEQELIDLDLKQLNENEVDVLFVPSPLPISLIKTIFFQCEEDQKIFEDECAIVRNVSVTDLTLSIDSNFFSNNITFGFFKELELPDLPEKNYDKIYSFGGLLATLFYFSKNGVTSNNIYHSMCEFRKANVDVNIDIIHVYQYVQNELQTGTEISSMYMGLLDAISTSKDVRDDIICFLSNSDNFEEDKIKVRANEISESLGTCYQVGEKTASEQFKAAKSPLEKMLVMIFLRDNIEDLMGYYLEGFNELDYLLFAMVFGIRDKFIGLPRFLRDYKGLQGYISIKMAEYAHLNYGKKLTFLEAYKLAKPLTLSDMFEKDSFKIWLANERPKINCLETTFKIPNGSYRLNSTSTGLELVFEGDAKKPRVKVIDDIFYRAIMSRTFESYNKYLKKYLQLR
jgi:hypothetical protein